MTLRELWDCISGDVSDFARTVTSDNVLDWPVSYVFSVALLSVFSLILSFVIFFVLISQSREILSQVVDKLGLKRVLGFFDRRFGVALGGTLFFLSLFVIAFSSLLLVDFLLSR